MSTNRNQLIENRSVARGLWALARLGGLGPLALRIHPKSGLQSSGWFRSFREASPVNKNGDVLPWWTYSSIDFLNGRIGRDCRVLEFGAGNSTLWLSRRAREVVSVEDDSAWAVRLSRRLPGNVKLLFVRHVDDVYFSLGPQGRFDVVVVDGLGDRMACADLALRHYLNDRGVVVWDNTDGPDWPSILGLMESRGFREVSFHGMAPQVVSHSRTTVFYRDHNVLGL